MPDLAGEIKLRDSLRVAGKNGQGASNPACADNGEGALQSALRAGVAGCKRAYVLRACMRKIDVFR
jgi:hypothetical protein